MKTLRVLLLATFFVVRWTEISWGPNGGAVPQEWWNHTQREKRFALEADAVHFARGATGHIAKDRVYVVKVLQSEADEQMIDFEARAAYYDSLSHPTHKRQGAR